MAERRIFGREEVASALRAETLARLHEARGKLALLETRYEKQFEDFERHVMTHGENYSEWDDYLEWKAYLLLKSQLEAKLNDLKIGNFEVA